MFDLARLIEDIGGSMPPAVKKVLKAAEENGWELNRPGMTLCLRFNHPTDELASPLYISWVLKRTPTGKLGLGFDSCSTASLVPLRPADVLEYLSDPTVILMDDADIEEASAKHDERVRPKWDDNAPPEINVIQRLRGGALNAEIIAVERHDKDTGEPRPKRRTAAEIIAEANRKMKEAAPSASASPASPSRPSAGGLRVTLPSRSRT